MVQSGGRKEKDIQSSESGRISSGIRGYVVGCLGRYVAGWEPGRIFGLFSLQCWRISSLCCLCVVSWEDICYSQESVRRMGAWEDIWSLEFVVWEDILVSGVCVLSWEDIYQSQESVERIGAWEDIILVSGVCGVGGYPSLWSLSLVRWEDIQWWWDGSLGGYLVWWDGRVSSVIGGYLSGRRGRISSDILN